MSSFHRNDRSASPVGAQPGPSDAVGADAVVRCPGAGTGGTLTALLLQDRPGARLSGSGDLDSRQALSAALGVVTGIPGPVVHLDLSAVSFLDTAAVAELVRAADALNRQGRCLLLHHPPYSLRKVVEMFPDECAALEVAA
ncbi:STAS domain-containing protein [Streptomyces sp. NPDC060048]|uniref:STAS domain-containing protein n=1 Tax=unclassified Streptomyces TaxID=2593676 RepID=UPI00369A7142